MNDDKKPVGVKLDEAFYKERYEKYVKAYGKLQEDHERLIRIAREALKHAEAALTAKEYYAWKSCKEALAALGEE